VGLLGICVTVCLCTPPAVASAKQPICHARHPLVKTPTVLVYKKLGADENAYVVLACIKPNGTSYVLAHDSVEVPSLFANQALVTVPRVAGDYAAVAFASGIQGITSCEKNLVLIPPAGPNPCPGPTYAIKVVNVRTGQSGGFGVSDVDASAATVVQNIRAGAPTALALSRAGAIAWIDDRGLVATRFHPRGKKLRGSPKVLDPNAKGLISLTRTTVTWYDLVNGAQITHRATLS
jgi:hypothetical protein